MKAAAETVCRSEAGRLFRTLGPAMEKARSPSLVHVRCTAAAPFVVDPRDRVEEKLVKSQRYAGAVGERILKIGPHLTKLLSNIKWLTFLRHSVAI